MGKFEENDGINPVALSPEDKQTIEAIENLDDPNKVQELLKEFRDDDELMTAIKNEPEADEAPKPEVTETPKAETVQNEPKQPETVNVQPIAEPPKPKQPEIVTITDEIIAKANPDEKAIFQSIRGRKMDQQALKNYVNAQKYIVELKAKVTQPIQQEKIEAPAETPKPDVNELPKIREQIVLESIRKRFPNLNIPETPEEYKKFKTDLNYVDPDQYLDLRDAEKQEATSFENEYKQVQYFRENYKDINQQQINLAIANIETEASEMGIDLKELGYDLGLDKAGYNKIIAELLLDESGMPHQDVVQIGAKGSLMEGIPLVNEKALANKFLQHHFKQIMQKVKLGGRKEGFQAATQHKETAPVIMGTRGTSGGRVDAGITPDKVKEMTPEQVKQALYG